ncbi:MAG TPA: sugar phosphate nucleotidyltransferase [Caulobacteraceae bacterium]|nr:sugar phosphate nucleotidyltransferase [Caulobacteraceae bacterium]
MIVPVILAGGEGKRLWPLSTPARPKPFIALTGEASLLGQTLARLNDAAMFASPIIVGAAEHRFLIAEEARRCGPARIVLEPAGRGTAPAAAAAALIAAAEDPEALLLIAPADHAIPDAAGFRAAVARGAGAASGGRFVLFGVRPEFAATGYGYIIPGAGDGSAVRPVERFVEKPSEEAARALIASGGLWNSGIFLMAARALIAELQRAAPEVLAAARAAVELAVADADFLRLAPASFAAAPSISLDVAVMERTRKAAVVEADFAWSDIGVWSALWRALPHDGAGNAVRGRAVLEDARGCLVFADGPTVAVMGLSDLVVVATPERVLVAPKHRDQDLRALVDRASAP